MGPAGGRTQAACPRQSAVALGGDMMTVKQFIQGVLVGEIRDIQQNGRHHYLSFGLIAQGIEFLGACLDDHEFSVESKSRKRFEKAIKELFPSEYREFLTGKGQPFDLYEHLRCGLLHIMLPNTDVELIQNDEVEKFAEHLTVARVRNRDRLILVSQVLYTDFKNACEEVVKRIDEERITHQKVYAGFMGTEP
jgi:hypothetical protein